MMKMTKDEHIDLINKIARQYQFSVSNRVQGKIFIKKIRKYNERKPHFYEVDVIFVGSLFGRLHRNDPSSWLSKEIMDLKGVSKIKVNKMIRQDAERAFQKRSDFLTISRWDFKIKNVTWLDEYTPKK